jgi:RNA polymerase sigma-70 factor (ECF subfamily)
MRHTEINRHRRRRPELLDDPDLPGARHLTAAAPSAEQLVLDRAFDAVVEAALLDLAPAMRQAVLLVDVDELSYAEASAVLGIPEGTLTSRLHRARRRIRHRVQAAGLSPRRHP